MAKVNITFKGKTIECDEVQPGVVQKTPSIFYIQDCVTKEWLYCFPERLERLNEKYNGDLSQYKGRGTKAKERDAVSEAKSVDKASKKPKAEVDEPVVA